MKLLLDTHVFLWIAQGKIENLSRKAVDLFEKSEEIWFSAASYWEISIKFSLGKLELHPDWVRDFDKGMQENQIQWLPIEKKHCLEVSVLPFHHRDPFDRLLIAQAKISNLTLLTKDRAFSLYSIPTIW